MLPCRSVDCFKGRAQILQIIAAGSSSLNDLIRWHFICGGQRPGDGRARAGCAVGEDRSVAVCHQSVVGCDHICCHRLMCQRLDHELQPGGLCGLRQHSAMMAGRHLHIRSVAQDPFYASRRNRGHVFRRDLRGCEKTGCDLAHVHEKTVTKRWWDCPASEAANRSHLLKKTAGRVYTAQNERCSGDARQTSRASQDGNATPHKTQGRKR